MHTLYLVCLILGGAYSVISLLGQGLFDGFDFFDLDLDFDFDFDFNFILLPLKPFTIMVFVTVFGGVGLIALNYLPPMLTLLPAIPSGIGVSGLLYYLVYVKLRRFETTTASEGDALFKRADVVERIPAGGYGKISYVMDNNILSGAAREYRPGLGIPKGVHVYILDVKDNVYYVSEDLDINNYNKREEVI